MYINNKKNGFTLAEILCALTIVGILIAFALPMLKPSQKAIKYQYINAYNTLSVAYYNSMINGKNPFQTTDDSGKTLSRTSEQDDGTKYLCEGLISYINTIADKDACSATKLVTIGSESFSDDIVKFVANNGMKFYLSGLVGNLDDEIPLYIAFVDVNGDMKPNNIEYTALKNGKLIEPDIFAFALLKTGRIVPIGAPEYDSTILSARFVYTDTSSGDEGYSKTLLPYNKAKSAAWGYYTDANEDYAKPEHYNINEPFTMNDVIRTIISDKSKIYKDFPKSLMGGSLDSEHCSNDDVESCYIFLDKYRPF